MRTCEKPTSGVKEYLQTRSEPTSAEKIKEEFKTQLLLVAGFKQEEIEKLDLLNMSDEEFQNLARQKLLGAMVNNGSKQRVVASDDVETCLS